MLKMSLTRLKFAELLFGGKKMTRTRPVFCRDGTFLRTREVLSLVVRLIGNCARESDVRYKKKINKLMR